MITMAQLEIEIPETVILYKFLHVGILNLERFL